MKYVQVEAKYRLLPRGEYAPAGKGSVSFYMSIRGDIKSPASIAAAKERATREIFATRLIPITAKIEITSIDIKEQEQPTKPKVEMTKDHRR